VCVDIYTYGCARVCVSHIQTYKILIYLFIYKELYVCMYVCVCVYIYIISVVKGSIKVLIFIKPQAQGLSSSTWGLIRRELGFQYQNSIRTAQFRLTETRDKSKLN